MYAMRMTMPFHHVIVEGTEGTFFMECQTSRNESAQQINFKFLISFPRQVKPENAQDE